MRYFIFFYKCQNTTSSQYGQRGYYGKSLPSLRKVSELVEDSSAYSKSQVNILSFNEVTEEDYGNFFVVEQGE